MKKLKLFFACLLMAVLSIGQVWAGETTYTMKTSGSGTAVEDNWTANTSASFNSSGAYWSCSATTNTFTITSGSGITGTITKVQVTGKRNKNKSYSIDVTVGGSALGSTFNGSGNATYDTEDTFSSSTGLTGTIVVSVSAAGGSNSSDKGSFWITSVTVTTEDGGGSSCSNTVAITKGAETNGTYTLSATEVCGDGDGEDVTISDITPAAGFEFDEITTSESGTVDNDLKKVTGITAATTITVKFKEKQKYTVSFNVGGSSASQTDIPETTAGAGIELPAGPTPTCTGWTFAGWKETSAVDEETTTAPTLLLAGANYKPAANCTLYAVYKRTESGAVTDQEVTETFENQAKESEYNKTKTYEASASNANIAWTMYYGCVSENVKLTGDQSAQMRWYKTASTTYGYIQNTTPISGLQSVSFNAKTDNGNSSTVKLSVWYSTDGDTWTNVKDNEAAPTTTTEISATIAGTVGTDYYVRIGVGDAGTAPSSSSAKLTIDDVHFSYKAGSSTTYYLSSPTCCTQHAVNIAAGIEHGSVSADPASACEGATITLTFTPALNYHLSAWTLNDVAQDIAENTFEMPGVDVTVSATFDQDACEPLGTPSVTVSGKAYPYNAVKLAWTAIEHADAYKVYIYDNEDNELEHNDAFAGEEYTIGQTLSASTTYKYSVQAISNTPATYCPSVVATGSFVTEALPTAHLTLIALGDEHEDTGDYSILTPFNLPSTAASCSKAFVGWDADPNRASAPTYPKGAEFTFQNTDAVTLYAVYADETPGEATLTKMTSADALADGDKVVIVANGTQYGVYQETQSSSYVKNWELAASTPAISELGAKKIWNVTADNTNWKFGDATNGYLYTSGSNNLAVSTDNATSWSVTWNESENGFILKSTGGRYFACRTDLSGDNANLFRMSGTSLGTNGVYGMDIYKYALGASTFDNYSTTCVAAPTAEPASASIAVAAAGGEGTLGVSYENVNLAGVTAALFNNEACTEAFDGGWLTASIEGDDKHIAYNAQANTSYNDARTAYIKLTAPETNGAANPAVVVIPVEQAKKPAVFASLAELVAASIATGTEVTVTFANEVITDDHYISQGTKRAGVLLTTKAANDKAIEIFYNKGETVVPAAWVIGGKLSATAMTFTWTFFSDQWELVPLGNDWTWDNGDLTYTAPKAVSSVVVSGSPAKKSYVDGEKFAPAGLIVTVNYTEGDPEVNPVGVTFTCDPVRVAKSDDPVSVNVVATFNEVDSDPFEVTGLTVGDIQPKTIAEFIEAEGTRCYLEGIVGTIDNTTYGNFYLTDASGTIYVYGCLTPSGESKKFAELGVEEGDQIKVIAEAYTKHATKGDEAVDVQFVSKVSAATIDIDDINMTVDDELLLSDIVATITPDAAQSATINYEVTEGTAVTISEDKIIASTEGEATITASIEAGVGYLAGSTTFTVTVSAAPVPFEGDYFVKVAKNSDLTAGEYLIVYEDGSLAFNGGLETLDAASNTVAVTFENGKIQGTPAVLAATFTIKLAGTIQSKSGYYIGQINDANGLASSTETQYNNAISIDEGNAVIVSEGGAYLRYNSTSGQTRFRYFKSTTYTGQKEIALYKKENAAPVYETVRGGLTAGNYYTICYPKSMTDVQGATLWSFVGKDTEFAYIEQEMATTIEAGKPYILYATATTVTAILGAEDAVAGTNGAIHGTLSPMDQDALNAAIAAGHDLYLVIGNELCRATGYALDGITPLTGNSLPAQRAYVVLDEITGGKPVGMPAHVRAMPMQKDQAQGFENLDASEKPLKVMIDGTLYILRGEKVYDATGRLVK